MLPYPKWRAWWICKVHGIWAVSSFTSTVSSSWGESTDGTSWEDYGSYQEDDDLDSWDQLYEDVPELVKPPELRQCTRRGAPKLIRSEVRGYNPYVARNDRRLAPFRPSYRQRRRTVSQRRV